MKIVKPDNLGIREAVKVLRQGGTVVYPTDTAYALGGVFDSKKVTKDILLIKNRVDEKFTLISSSLNQVKHFFKLDRVGLKLTKKYWPGPLSIVVSDKFAVRVPANKLAQTLARRAGKPLIATSANLSGNDNLYSSEKVIKEFAGRKCRPDLMIDAGVLPKIKPSTLVKIEDGKLKVIRKGSVKPKF